MSIPGLPSTADINIKPRLRRSNVAIAFENNRLMEMLRLGASEYQIKQDLKLTDYNYKKRIKKLGQQDLKDILDQQTVEARANLLMTCIHKIKALEIEANNMLIAGNLKPLEKAAVMDRVRQYAMDIAKLITEGPYMFRVIQDGFYRRDTSQSIESTNPSPLPNTEPETEDNKSVF